MTLTLVLFALADRVTMIMWHANTDKIPTTIDVIIQGKNHFSYMINDGSFPAILVFASVFIITAFGKILFTGYARDLIIIMIRCRYIKCSRLSIQWAALRVCVHLMVQRTLFTGRKWAHSQLCPTGSQTSITYCHVTLCALWDNLV